MASYNYVQIRFSEKSAKKLLEGLKATKKDIKKLAEDISSDLANEAEKYLKKMYKQSPNIGDLNIDFSSIVINKKKTKNGYNVTASGKDVLYEEYGTGDVGESHNHENKNARPSLNPYNSGVTIKDVTEATKKQLDLLKKYNITSGNFWIYNLNDGTREPIPTQGVQAGMEMWNTRKHIRSKEIREKIYGKRVKEFNDKLINAIKK